MTEHFSSGLRQYTGWQYERMHTKTIHMHLCMISWKLIAWCKGVIY